MSDTDERRLTGAQAVEERQHTHASLLSVTIYNIHIRHRISACTEHAGKSVLPVVSRTQQSFGQRGLVPAEKAFPRIFQQHLLVHFRAQQILQAGSAIDSETRIARLNGCSGRRHLLGNIINQPLTLGNPLGRR